MTNETEISARFQFEQTSMNFLPAFLVPIRVKHKHTSRDHCHSRHRRSLHSLSLQMVKWCMCEQGRSAYRPVMNVS